MFKKNKDFINYFNKFFKKITCSYSRTIVKIIQLNKRTVTIFLTTQGLYSLIDIELLNLNLLSNSFLKTLIKKNVCFINNYKESYKIKLVLNDYINALCYPVVYKFKLLGRYYKIKKKTNNFLHCYLNYSHKMFFLNKVKYTFFMVKIKRGRVLLVSNLNLNITHESLYPFNTLRRLNFYTSKGFKLTFLSKIRRKGKGPMII